MDSPFDDISSISKFLPNLSHRLIAINQDGFTARQCRHTPTKFDELLG